MDQQEKEKLERIKGYCYKDLNGNAFAILSLLLSNHPSEHISNFFDILSEDELKKRHFINIDWKAIARIANSCVSRQETYKYLTQL